MDPSDEPPAKHARVAVDTDPPLHPAGHRLALPPGWLGCPNHGAALCRGLLLPCKVPLGAAFDGVLSGSRAGRRFRPADAVAAASAGGQRVVLAVVDLTKTLRYYDPSRELPHDVRHFKLPCEGSEAPAPQDAALFCAVLQSELDRWRRLPGDPASRPRPAFVVHCTHGFNRTGARPSHRAVPALPHSPSSLLTPPRLQALCVHYLMRGERVWPDLPAALHEFAAARPPGIYKESYVACAQPRSPLCGARAAAEPPAPAALFEYYREVRPAPPSCVCPATPAWKREEEEGPGPLAADDVPSGDLWGAPPPPPSPTPPPPARRGGAVLRLTGALRTHAGKDNPTYMAAGRGPPLGVPDERPPPSAPASATPKHDDPLGEEVPAWVASSVRGLCAQLCAPSQAAALAALAAAPCGPGPSSFPGSQPVSLSRANAGLLADPALRYLVSWKADGTRYLLLLMHAAAYLLDRAGRVRRCQMRFPTEERVPGKPHRRAHTHHWTLLDGEMVVDTPGGGEPPVRRFLVYDCCAIGGVRPPGRARGGAVKDARAAPSRTRRPPARLRC